MAAPKPESYMVILSLRVTLERPSRSSRRLWRQIAEALPERVANLVPDVVADDAIGALIDWVERIGYDAQGYQTRTEVPERLRSAEN